MPYPNISTIEVKEIECSKVKVKSYSLDKIFRSIRINPNYPVLLNIDLEGAEYKVFEEAKNLDKIRKYLMKEGYKIYKVEDFNYIAY